MKILCITPAYYPAVSWGGPIVSVHLLNKELVRLGHKVIVYTTTFGLTKTQINADKNTDQHGFAMNELDGVRIFYFKSFKVGQWLVPIRLAKKLWGESSNFDIFHINEVWNPASWLSGLALSFRGKKFVISPRGAIDLVVIKKRNYFLKLLLYHFFIKYIFKKAAGFHFTSEYERDKFLEFTQIKATQYEFLTNIRKITTKASSQKSAMIFNPLDITEFQNRVDKNILAKWNLQDKKYFLYLGRLSWKKGLEILVNAFGNLMNATKYEISTNIQNSGEINDVRVSPRLSLRQSAHYLVVAGPDEAGYQKKIEKMVAEKNLTDKIIFTGLVQGDYKLALLQNAQAFILPSYSENFGIVVAEAMAVGIPVIISTGVGIKDVVEKYQAGLIFDIETNPAGNLLEKMKEVVNPDVRQQLIENGKKLVIEQFNPEAVARQILESYNVVKEVKYQ